MYDVITIGAGVRDVFLISDEFIALKSKKFKTGMGECVALGSKVELEHIVLTTGGGATNAAASFGSLGLKTACICKIGNDSPGRDIIDDLHRFNVDTQLIKVAKRGATGYSTLLTMKDGERTALVYRGVSKQLTAKDINFTDIKKPKWSYLTSLGGNLKLATKIIKTASKAKTKIMWNPGSSELKAGTKQLKSLFPLVDILNLNTEELQLLTGEKTIKKGCHKIHADGTIRLITDGNKGSYTYQDGNVVFIGTTGATSINRTGAGDAFGSGFLTGWIKTNDLATAATIGTLNAESVIQKHGAKNGILKRLPSKAKLKQINTRSL